MNTKTKTDTEYQTTKIQVSKILNFQAEVLCTNICEGPEELTNVSGLYTSGRGWTSSMTSSTSSRAKRLNRKSKNILYDQVICQYFLAQRKLMFHSEKSNNELKKKFCQNMLA